MSQYLRKGYVKIFKQTKKFLEETRLNGNLATWSIISMKTGYEEMLKRARSQLPHETLEQKRFEFPKPRSSTIGVRTIIYNFKEICDTLDRDPHHLMKFLSGELATAGTLDNSRAIFQGKFPRDTLNRLIKRYIDDFVVCPVCKLPDTKVVKEKRFHFLICEACGAKSSIRPV